MAGKKATVVDPAEIAEVSEFIFAQDALKEFKEAHADLFEELEGLVERYNTTLEQADKAVRANKVSSGPFNLYQFTVKYDAEALYNAIGRDRFLDIGGAIQNLPSYSIDRGRLEACIAQNKVPKEVVDTIRTESPAYHAPKKLLIP